MGNFYDDNEDLRWYIDRGIDWTDLVAITEYEWRAPEHPESVEAAVDLYRDVLRLIGEFASEAVAPVAKEIDKDKPRVEAGEVVHPPEFDQVMAGLKDMEVYGMCLPRELGGMNLPFLAYMASIELIGRADVSVVAHYGFHGGIAMALLLYSVLEGTTEFDTAEGKIKSTRWAQAIEEIRAGDAWGSMDITESDAGSDMGALRSKGEQDADGNWFVTGQKIYITFGHGKWHIVIARTEPVAKADDPFAGLGGLSLFLVPAYTDTPQGRVRHSTIDGVETKLGHNGSATVAISFERAPAELIGKRGEGFKGMLLLMNNARVGVGFESLGLCEAATRMAAEYAAQRPSMGKMIDRHEMIADYLDEMRTDCQAIRAITMTAGYHEEMSQKLRLKGQFFPPTDPAEVAKLDALQKRHASKARRLTPLVKYLASEKAVEMARRAIQIHGGAGYTKDYEAEKLLRDAIVFPIYEGTSQIQSLMAMKDTLIGAIKKPQDFLRRAAAARWAAVSARDPHTRRVAKLQSLSYATQQHLMTRIVGGKFSGLRGTPVTDWPGAFGDWDPKRDFAPAMLHAERLIRILIDVAVAETLLDQVKVDPARADVLERWLERAEPRCRSMHDIVTTTGERILAQLSGAGGTSEAAK